MQNEMLALQERHNDYFNKCEALGVTRAEASGILDEELKKLIETSKPNSFAFENAWRRLSNK